MPSTRGSLKLTGLWEPHSLRGRPQGALFAALCIVTLVVIGYADTRDGARTTIGSLEVVPLMAAGWVLGDWPLVAVGMGAVLMRAFTAAAGGIDGVTAATQICIVPFVLVISRVGAGAVESARRTAARDRLVAEVARIATSADSVQDVLGQVLATVARDGLRGGTISLIDERNQLYIAASEGTLDPAVRDFRMPVGQGIMGQVAATGTPVLITDMDAPDVPASPTRKLGTNASLRSMVVVPMMAAGRVIGVIEFDSEQPARFDEGDLTFLSQVALAVSGAVQRAGALQLADAQLQRRVRELSILLDAARLLAASLDRADLVDRVARSAAAIALVNLEGRRRASVIRVAGGSTQIIGEYDESGGELRGFEAPLEDNPGLAECVRSGRPVAVLRDLFKGEVAERAADLGMSGAAYAPIFVRGEAWGALGVTTREDYRFSDEDLRLLQGMADLAGLAIANAELLDMERDRNRELSEHSRRMSALDQAKSEFLRLASHELRGPLGVLRGYVSMLADGTLGELPEGAGRVMPVMTAKVVEMNILIDQMLETARLEDSRLQLMLDDVDLRAILDSAVETMAPLAGAAHPIKVASPSEPVMVRADAGRVATILTNLIDNAVKYSPEGGEVTCTVEIGADDSATVVITDQGVGIADADMPRLFTRFGRLVTPDNSHIPGTGLGLYLSRELARLHGGDITATSVVRQGSTFTVRLPLARNVAETGLEEEPRADVDPAVPVLRG